MKNKLVIITEFNRHSLYFFDQKSNLHVIKEGNNDEYKITSEVELKAFEKSVMATSEYRSNFVSMPDHCYIVTYNLSPRFLGASLDRLYKKFSSVYLYFWLKKMETIQNSINYYSQEIYSMKCSACKTWGALYEDGEDGYISTEEFTNTGDCSRLLCQECYFSLKCSECENVMYEPDELYQTDNGQLCPDCLDSRKDSDHWNEVEGQDEAESVMRMSDYQ